MYTLEPPICLLVNTLSVKIYAFGVTRENISEKHFCHESGKNYFYKRQKFQGKFVFCKCFELLKTFGNISKYFYPYNINKTSLKNY